MAVSPAPLVGTNEETHRQNLRELQEEGLTSLYIGTMLAGLGLIYLTFNASGLWVLGTLGLVLIFSPLPILRFFSGHYFVKAWFLLSLWTGCILFASQWIPQAPIEFFLVIPVTLAAVIVSPKAGILLASAITLIFAILARYTTLPLVSDWALLSVLFWVSLIFTWLALQPVFSALGWSWQHFLLARQELEQARDAQADLKQAIKDLADASVQMARLNKLLGIARQAAEEAERAKAEFVANVSHELRTPLNMIIGFSEMMLNASNTYGRIPKPLRADLAVILRNSQHLSELIDDVLDLSQIEAGKMALTREQVLLREIVDAAAIAIRPLFVTKNLYLNVEVPVDLLVTCDRTRIREVLLNLLSNAGRFVETGGVTVRARVNENRVEVSVADTGPGISVQDQERLFQPFQQVDGTIRRRYGGSGLGLSISRHFVDLHGGKMWMESAVGRGTTIFFSLPFEPAVSSHSSFSRWMGSEWEYRQRTRRWLAPKPNVRPRLVLVEKGNQFQRLLCRYLGEVEIASVAGLEEAATELAKNPAQALLVNDFDIEQTIQRIWDQNLLPNGTPALICGIPGDEEAARNLGAEAYLIKPVSRDSLLKVLDRLQIPGGTVLIIDDEQDAIQLFWRMLVSSDRGYRVLTASNGEEGIGLLSSERPDVILLDLSMAGMDGFQFLARRKEQPAWQSIPVVIMSARDPEGHPVAASSVGITKGGGLSIPQILTFVEMVCGPFPINEPTGGPMSQEASSD